MSTPARVMVVDDDEDIRESVVDVLEDEGYEVTAVANGREALDALSALPERPHVLLVDLMMPIMDGWELLAELQRSPELAEIPKVIFTAQTTSRTERADADGYLPKPLKINDLLEMIHRFTHSDDRR